MSKNWATGDVILASDLNRLEEGATRQAVKVSALAADANLATAVAGINAILTGMKNAGLMVGETWPTLTVSKDLDDTWPGHADRQENTEAISSVAESDGVITITLSKPVEELKDFDGGGSWGVHKWLGIGVRPWTSAITGLTYNGSALTSADVEEAESVGLTDAGYFVRWVAADLVLAGDNSQASKDTFTIQANNYNKATYKLKIVEPLI